MSTSSIFGKAQPKSRVGSLVHLLTLLRSLENLLNGSRVDFAISTINSISNSRLTYEVIFIASTKDVAIFGKSINNLSICDTQFLSVIQAIASQALHSGVSMLPILFHKHIIFESNLMSCNIISIVLNIFGIFGGGGRSGNLMFGRLGSSGKSGNSGREGSDHILGRDIFNDQLKLGVSGKVRSGN